MTAVADSFDHPVKPRGNYRVALDFLECYEGSYHPGEDLNRGSGNADLNDPVYAVANGKVVASGYYTHRWGNIILIEHRAPSGYKFTLPDGRKVDAVWSQYAHLNERKYANGQPVSAGDEIQKGQQIGRIGKGAGNIFWAHLHFEIRYQYRSANAWTSGCTNSFRNTILQYYVDPTNFINNNRQVGPGLDHSVQFYIHANHEGGYCWSDEEGRWNLHSTCDEETSSVLLKSGWSVRVFRDRGLKSSSKCFTSSDDDFANDRFDDGSELNDKVSSYYLYHRTNCPPLIRVPNPPSTLRVTGSTRDSIAIAWDDKSDNEKGFYIYKWDASQRDFFYHDSVGADIRSYTDTGLDCGSDYYYKVSAYNEAGTSPQTDYIGGDTSDCPQLPTKPSNYSPADNTILDRTHNIVLSWNTNGTNCTVHIWGGNIDISPSGNCTSLTLGSQYGGSYNWQVTASNSEGSTQGPVWHFKVRPHAPTNLSATLIGSSRVTLNWTKSPDAPDGVDGYTVYIDGNSFMSVGSSTTSFHLILIGSSCNRRYSYYVTTSRQGVTSHPGNTASVTTPPCKPDLLPAQWEDWQYPIVPSSITGTAVVNTLYANRATYIDWGVANNGGVDSGGDVYGDLYIDDTRLSHYNFGNIQWESSLAFSDWMHTVSTPGWHTLKVVADPDNLIAESDVFNDD